MSLDPNVWGPPLWDFLFTLIFKASGCTEQEHLLLFSTLEKVIPCQACRRDYSVHKAMLKEKNVCVGKENPSRSAAIWLWTMHDIINQKLGKICISFDQLKERHRLFYCLTNEFTAIDIFFCMTICVKGKHVIDFVTACTPFFKNSFLFRIPSLIPTLHEKTLEKNLFETHVNLCAAYNIPPPSNIKIFKQKFQANESELGKEHPRQDESTEEETASHFARRAKKKVHTGNGTRNDSTKTKTARGKSPLQFSTYF